MFRGGGWARLQRRALESRLRRVRRKAHNWMKHMHYEAIREAFKLGDLMILPVFESSRMARRASRIFNAGVARDMYTWSHYTFMQRMWSKVQTTSNKCMAFTREPGTSKTCDACGHAVEGLGGAKVFACACGHRACRDAHGARGNLLAALGAASNLAWDGIKR